MWIGYAESPDAVENDVFMKYSESGDLIPSWFSAGFQIRRFDPDFTEIAFTEKTKAVEELLEGISYQEQITEEILSDLSRFYDINLNIAVLLYNFEFTGLIKELVNEKARLYFIGSYTYNP